MSDAPKLACPFCGCIDVRYAPGHNKYIHKFYCFDANCEAVIEFQAASKSGAVECFTRRAHNAEAQKWRECLELHWFLEELAAMINYLFCTNKLVAYHEAEEIFAQCESKYDRLEKELRDSHEQGAVCPK